MDYALIVSSVVGGFGVYWGASMLWPEPEKEMLWKGVGAATAVYLYSQSVQVPLVYPLVSKVV